MSKNMSREQEKAMFARKTDGKEYCRDYSLPKNMDKKGNSYVVNTNYSNVSKRDEYEVVMGNLKTNEIEDKKYFVKREDAEKYGKEWLRRQR